MTFISYPYNLGTAPWSILFLYKLIVHNITLLHSLKGYDKKSLSKTFKDILKLSIIGLIHLSEDWIALETSIGLKQYTEESPDTHEIFFHNIGSVLLNLLCFYSEFYKYFLLSIQKVVYSTSYIGSTSNIYLYFCNFSLQNDYKKVKLEEN